MPRKRGPCSAAAWRCGSSGAPHPAELRSATFARKREKEEAGMGGEVAARYGDGRDARRRAARNRYPFAGGRRALPRHPRAHALRAQHCEPQRGDGRFARARLARRARRLFRGARLWGRLSGLPRTPRLRGALHQISERGPRRFRLLRLAAAAILVRWAHRHHGPVLWGPYAGRARLPRSAGAQGTTHRFGRFRRFLARRHPAIRRLRAEAGDLGP